MKDVVRSMKDVVLNMLASWAVVMVLALVLAVPVTVVYVIAHFVMKWW